MINNLLDGRYRIKKLLGRGGFGQTYLAEDTKRPGNPPCVVKHLHPQSKDPEFIAIARRLFASEAETLEKLGDLDQLPRLYAYFEENNEFFLVQEFIDGNPLSHELEPSKPWEETQVIEMLQSILSILVAIHNRGVIHRDIKPENIIRRKSDRKLVLIDFGAVKQVMQDTGRSNVSVAIGTSGYISAEQAQGKPKFASDIYAVGMLAIQALTGVPPSHFGEDSNGEVQWQICVDLNLISPHLIDILEKMVKRDYRQRFASAEDVLNALEVSTLEVALHQPTELVSSPPPLFKLLKPLPIGLATMATMLVLGGGFILPKLINRNTCAEIQKCKGLPQGTFRFSSGTSWILVKNSLETELKKYHPNLIMSYVNPIDGQPSSGKAVQMLLDGEVDFALVARPLEEVIWQKAKERGIDLVQQKVAIGGLALAVHPSVEISSLSLTQLRDIYSGKVKNWQELGGNNLAIKPIVRPGVLDEGAKSILGDIKSKDLPKSVTRVSNPSQGFRLLQKTPGAVFWSSLGLMRKQCNVKIIALSAESKPPISPVLNNQDCPRKINVADIKSAMYPITSFMFVTYDKNNNRSVQAATNYIRLLQTQEGKKIFDDHGFVYLD